MDEEGTPTSAGDVAGTAENSGGDAACMGSRSEFGGRSTADIPENGHNPEVSHGADEHRRKQHHHEPAADVQREGHGGDTQPVNEKRTGVATATASRTARVHGVPAEEETEQH